MLDDLKAAEACGGDPSTCYVDCCRRHVCRRLALAEARWERDRHGKEAFIGSSAYGAYQAARRELEAAREAARG